MTGFEKRLYFGFGVLAVLFTPLMVAAFFVISELEVTQGELLSKNAQDVISAERLSSLTHESMGLVHGFVLRGDHNTIKQFETVHQDFKKTASNLLLSLEPDEDPALLREGVSELVEQNVDIQKVQLKAARLNADRVAKRLVIGLIAACGFALLATVAIVILLWQMIRNKAQEDSLRDEQMKLELELSNARKEAIEVVAHDLKNPLSALKMSHELLRDELANEIAASPDVAMGFQIADRSMQTMQRLIDNQLDHTKIEAGQLWLDKKVMNISELMRDLEVRYRPLFEAKGLSLAAKADRALFAEIDVARIDQVISNLLGNAMKFTPAGGVVQLVAKRLESQIAISVIDNGPGISTEAREHIFERYWQVKETAKKGTGLGLSIAKGIVEAHGGELSCESQVGKGCEFRFTIHAVDVGQGAYRPTELSH